MKLVRRLALAAGTMFVLTVPAFAQTSGPAPRIWVDVNFGMASSAATASTYSFETELFLEPLVLGARYPKPSGAMGIDIGGGYMVTRQFGAGVTVSGFGHNDAAELSLLVPHPFHYNASASATGGTPALERRERAVHLEAAFVPFSNGRLSLRVFGGPSFFGYRADMVRDMDFDQTATVDENVNVVNITSADLVDVTASAVGGHAGASFSYFFTGTLGAGAFARYSGATVELTPEPMSEVTQKVKVGGFTVGAGLRLRF